MGSGKGKARRAQDKISKALSEFNKPEVRGEPVIVLGPKPAGYVGLGYTNGEIIVRYPDGEIGAVKLSEIRDAAPLADPLPVGDVKRVSF
jgi:hypothetical protein